MRDPRPIAIYARTSREDPEARKVSIEQQVEDGRRLIREKKLSVSEKYIFIDRDCSGKTLPLIWCKSERATGREGLSNLIKAIQSGKVSGVVIRKLDRLSRSVSLSQDLFKLFREHNLLLLATDEMLPVGDDGASEFALHVLFGASQLQLRQISENIKASKAYQKRQGRKLGGVRLLGYEDAGVGKVRIVHKEKQIVQEMFQRYDKEESLCHIADWLNKEHRDLVKRRWYYSTVRIKLSNPLYIGIIYDEKGRAIKSSVYKPIVDPKLFKRVQERLEINKNTRVGKNLRKHLLSGILFCGECGGRLTPYVETTTKNSVRTRKWWVYKCRERHKHRPFGMREQWWEEWVEKCIVKKYMPVEETTDSSVALELQLSRISANRQNAYKAMTKTQKTYDEWTIIDADLKREEDITKASISQINVRQGSIPNSRKWTSLNLNDKRKYLKAIIEKIVVSEDGVVTRFKGQGRSFGDNILQEEFAKNLEIYWPRMLRKCVKGQWGNGLFPLRVGKKIFGMWITPKGKSSPVPSAVESDDKDNNLGVWIGSKGRIPPKEFKTGNKVWRFDMAKMSSGKPIMAVDWTAYLGMSFRYPAPSGQKYCNLCGKCKPLSDFNSNGSHLSYACRECANQDRRSKQEKALPPHQD